MKFAADVEWLILVVGNPSINAGLTIRFGSPDVGSLPSASAVAFSRAKAPSQGSLPCTLSHAWKRSGVLIKG